MQQRQFEHLQFTTRRQNKTSYQQLTTTYIHISMYVGVCVCVCMYLPESANIVGVSLQCESQFERNISNERTKESKQERSVKCMSRRRRRRRKPYKKAIKTTKIKQQCETPTVDEQVKQQAN